jgi:tetratricopeptide (TPR) repeat protein
MRSQNSALSNEFSDSYPRFRKKTARAFTAFLFIVILAGCGATAELGISELLDLGHKYLLEENYEEAILTFEKAIAVESKNALGYIGAAMADMGLEKPEEAVAILERGLEVIGAIGADARDNSEGIVFKGINYIIDLIELIKSGEYSAGAAEQIWQDAYAVWTGTTAPVDGSEETIADSEEEEVPEQTGNLTGKAPLSLDDLAAWGFPWGVTIDELVGKYGITLQDAEGLSRMREFGEESWMPGGDDYGASFETDTRRFTYADRFEGGKTGPRGIRLGMTLEEAVNLFAIGNPDILEFVKDPTYENMRKYDATPDDYGYLAINDNSDFESADGWQNLSVACNNERIDLSIWLMVNTGGQFHIGCDIEKGTIQQIHINYWYDLDWT